MPLFVSLLVGMRYTYLKGRSGSVQTLFIAGTIAMLTLIFGLVGWVTSRFS
ncbi:MAG: hypothetical protein ABI939_12685 [Anaerolineaceae bacterium]